MTKKPPVYNVEQKIDYITHTAKNKPIFDDVIGTPKPTRPLIKNYDTAQIYPTGMIVQWHSDRPDMKIHTTMTGKTLDVMRNIGFTDTEIVQALQKTDKSNFKRIDLALTSERDDGTTHGFLPRYAHFAALRGECQTVMKLDKPVVDKNLNIETAYIGRRDKREYLRVYDKGIELGEAANMLIRVELERHSTANTIARDIVSGADYGAIINRYISFPKSPDWIAIVGSDKKSHTRSKKELKVNEDIEHEKLWQWLFSSAAPALAKALYKDNIDPNINNNADKFAKIVADTYNRLIDEKMQD